MRKILVLAIFALLTGGCLTGGSSPGAVSVADDSGSTQPGGGTTPGGETTYGSVTLSWTAPTYNEDGSVLTDLDGYRIYWGTAPGQYPNSVTLDNESITIYVLENVPAGTYEFVATSFNRAGVESRYSNPATKTVP